MSSQEVSDTVNNRRSYSLNDVRSADVRLPVDSLDEWIDRAIVEAMDRIITPQVEVTPQAEVTHKDFPHANKELRSIAERNPGAYNVYGYRGQYRNNDVEKMFLSGWVSVDLETWLRCIRSKNFVGKQSGNYALVYYQNPYRLDREQADRDIYYIFDSGGVTSPDYLPPAPHSLKSILSEIHPDDSESYCDDMRSFLRDSLGARGYFIRYTMEHAQALQSAEDFYVPSAVAQNPSYDTFDAIKDML